MAEQDGQQDKEDLERPGVESPLVRSRAPLASRELVSRGLKEVLDRDVLARKIRVLVVDDIAETRNLLGKLLGFYPEIGAVAEARTGLEAMAAYEEFLPDVVSMDFYMPDMDGVTATNVICRRHAGARVFLLSVAGDANVMSAAMYAGALDWVSKPPADDELFATIQNLAGQQNVGATKKRNRRSAEQRAQASRSPVVVLPDDLRDVQQSINSAQRSLHDILLMASSIAEDNAHSIEIGKKLDAQCQNSLESLDEAHQIYKDRVDHESPQLKPYRKIPMNQLPSDIYALFEVEHIVQYAVWDLQYLAKATTNWREWGLAHEELGDIAKMWGLLAQSHLQRVVDVR